jgi:hypothetical protein
MYDTEEERREALRRARHKHYLKRRERMLEYARIYYQENKARIAELQRQRYYIKKAIDDGMLTIDDCQTLLA